MSAFHYHFVEGFVFNTYEDFHQLSRHYKCPVLFKSALLDWPCVSDWKDKGDLEALAKEEAEGWPHRKYRQFYPDQSTGRLHLTDGRSVFIKASTLEFLTSRKNVADSKRSKTYAT